MGSYVDRVNNAWRLTVVDNNNGVFRQDFFDTKEEAFRLCKKMKEIGLGPWCGEDYDASGFVGNLPTKVLSDRARAIAATKAKYA